MGRFRILVIFSAFWVNLQAEANCYSSFVFRGQVISPGAAAKSDNELQAAHDEGFRVIHEMRALVSDVEPGAGNYGLVWILPPENGAQTEEDRRYMRWRLDTLSRLEKKPSITAALSGFHDPTSIQDTNRRLIRSTSPQRYIRTQAVTAWIADLASTVYLKAAPVIGLSSLDIPHDEPTWCERAENYLAALTDVRSACSFFKVVRENMLALTGQRGGKRTLNTNDFMWLSARATFPSVGSRTYDVGFTIVNEAHPQPLMLTAYVHNAQDQPKLRH